MPPHAARDCVRISAAFMYYHYLPTYDYHHHYPSSSERRRIHIAGASQGSAKEASRQKEASKEVSQKEVSQKEVATKEARRQEVIHPPLPNREARSPGIEYEALPTLPPTNAYEVGAVPTGSPTGDRYTPTPTTYLPSHYRR